jgi:hypothetical protein
MFDFTTGMCVFNAYARLRRRRDRCSMHPTKVLCGRSQVRCTRARSIQPARRDVGADVRCPDELKDEIAFNIGERTDLVVDIAVVALRLHPGVVCR